MEAFSEFNDPHDEPPPPPPDFADMLPALPEFVPPLTREQIQRFNRDNRAFLQSLSRLTAAEAEALHALAQVPASPGTQTWATLTAGAGVYLTSFVWGTLVGNLVAVLDPAAGRWAFDAVASGMHVAFGENVGAVVRTAHGSAASPDGAAVMDYNTMVAQLTVHQLRGDKQAVAQCHKDLDAIVNSVKARDEMLRRAFERNPMLSAWIRNELTNEFPYICFSITYLLAGGVQPTLRALFGQMSSLSLTQRQWSLAVASWLPYAVCGTAAGALTVAGQNKLRKMFENPPVPLAGIHDPRVRQSHIDQATAMLEELEARHATLEELLQRVARQRDQGDIKREVATGSLADIRHAMKTNEREQRRQIKRLRALQGHLSTNDMLIRRSMAASVLGKPKNRQAYLNRSRLPMTMRLCARVIGNAVALIPYVIEMGHMSALSANLLPWELMEPDNPQFASPEAQQEYIDRAILELLPMSMMMGFVLIAAWYLRGLTQPMVERLVLAPAVGVALGVRDAVWGAPEHDAEPAPPNVVIHFGDEGPVPDPASPRSPREVSRLFRPASESKSERPRARTLSVDIPPPPPEDARPVPEMSPEQGRRLTRDSRAGRADMFSEIEADSSAEEHDSSDPDDEPPMSPMPLAGPRRSSPTK